MGKSIYEADKVMLYKNISPTARYFSSWMRSGLYFDKMINNWRNKLSEWKLCHFGVEAFFENDDICMSFLTQNGSI
jgi:hypothetical protein